MPKSILLVIFLLCGLNSNAQLLVRDGNCYVYGSEKICDSESIEHVLSTNLDALGWYLKSKSSSERANNFGYLAILGIAGSSWFIQLNSNKPTSGVDLRPISLGIGVILVSCVFGTIGIVNSVKSTRESEKVIHVFNGVSFGYDNPEERIIITYGIMDNGVGVGLNF